MNYFSTLMRLLWHRFLNWQMLATLLTLVTLYQFVLRNHAFLDLIGRLLAKLELPMVPNHEDVPQRGDVLGGVGKTKVSWELRKGQACVYAVQGRRPRMEDRFNIVSNVQHTSIFGVFDGHGGEFASDFVEKSVFKALLIQFLKTFNSHDKQNGRKDGEEHRVGLNGKSWAKAGDTFGGSVDGGKGGGSMDMERVLRQEILNVDKDLLEAEKLTGDISGTTLLVATLRGHELVVANVGDSRGVLCDQYNDVIPLSYDHKPQLANERRRIKEAGGFVSFNGVWRVAGILATSRALGDYPLKDKGFVIADPDVVTFDLRKFRPKFMILATDGLWDVFTNEEAVAFIAPRLDEENYGSKALVLQAYYRGSLDNITVMVVKFAYDRDDDDDDAVGEGRKEKKKEEDRKVVKERAVERGRTTGRVDEKKIDGEKVQNGVVNAGKEVLEEVDGGDKKVEKVFVGGGGVVGVGKVVEYEDGGVVFKEKEASSLVDTSISEEAVQAEMVIKGRSEGRSGRSEGRSGRSEERGFFKFEKSAQSSTETCERREMSKGGVCVLDANAESRDSDEASDCRETPAKEGQRGLLRGVLERGMRASEEVEVSSSRVSVETMGWKGHKEDVPINPLLQHSTSAHDSDAQVDDDGAGVDEV